MTNPPPPGLQFSDDLDAAEYLDAADWCAQRGSWRSGDELPPGLSDCIRAIIGSDPDDFAERVRDAKLSQVGGLA